VTTRPESSKSGAIETSHAPLKTCDSSSAAVADAQDRPEFVDLYRPVAVAANAVRPSGAISTSRTAGS
jgi:hypothetical protein